MDKTWNKPKAAVIKCKCGKVVAAITKANINMGAEFKESLTNLIAEGGSFELVDLQNTQVNVTACTCTEKEVTNV